MNQKLWRLSIVVLAVSRRNWALNSPKGRAVSLLFENDADWEHFADRSSGLLFHEPATKIEAAEVCREHNESLFEFEKMKDIDSQLVYQQYLGNLDEEVWVSSNGEACSTFIAAPTMSFGDPIGQFPLSQNVTCIDRDNATALPFLCTNSAPHTSKVDTDFTSSPRIDIVSENTIFTGTRDHLSFRFMGIPFAQPPVGKLRLRMPTPWKGATVDATTPKSGCLQYGHFVDGNARELNPWGFSEDCLYLNVFTPYIPSTATTPTTLKPVLVWIHGGGNFCGLGSDPTFDGGPFVSRTDTVIVTFNYRLNIFGFLSLGDDVIAGNYALADKIAALQWVHDNIAAFGGDPENVTVFGQSAGGWSVVDLLRSPPAKGLFNRAIVMSGGVVTGYASQEVAAAMYEPLVSPLCNSTGNERLECLQALPAEQLLDLARGVFSWSSVQDGEYVLDSAIQQIEQGVEINKVPVLMGWMADEFQSVLDMISPDENDFGKTLTKVFGPDLARKVSDSGLWKISEELTPYNATINVYSDIIFLCPAAEIIKAATNSNAFSALYAYAMKRAYPQPYLNLHGLCSFPVGHPEEPHYACHSGDLYPVFGTYHLLEQPARVLEDIHFTALVQDMWASFARTGIPNPDKSYLQVRGRAYESTLRVLEGENGWSWPEAGAGGVASLDYPGLAVEAQLPEQENGRCAFLLQEGAETVLQSMTRVLGKPDQ
ncbi:hypothetical protein VNI00_000581 [Paramarasmius palmivorus]|uniref:Carboxylesterase type B domain-containing protein n=1 Tax=Paramarasmius palmivorus TaxID=297713 RepID=A0AAW0E8A3_9AGAR